MLVNDSDPTIANVNRIFVKLTELKLLCFLKSVDYYRHLNHFES